MGHSIEDLMFLSGWQKKNPANGVSGKSLKWSRIDIEAENAWYDGLNADANPYAENSIEHSAWYNRWYQCNTNLA